MTLMSDTMLFCARDRNSVESVSFDCVTLAVRAGEVFYEGNGSELIVNAFEFCSGGA